MSAPKRIRLQRTKGWRKPAGAVVVSRPSVLGNPFIVGVTTTIHCFSDHLTHEADIEITPEIAVAAYRSYMATRLTVFNPDDPEDVEYVQLWRARLDKLAGHDLACWCPLDQPCHADVLLELANGATA